MEITPFFSGSIVWRDKCRYFFLVFKAWDLARSTRNVLLYNISQNQLLGSSERRFWVILFCWSFWKFNFMLVGSLQVVFKLRELSRSMWLAILYDICRNQLLGCSERRFWVRFAPLDVKYALKLTSRIINFATLDPRRSPRSPKGIPRGRYALLY